jgi:hypothetical protein
MATHKLDGEKNGTLGSTRLLREPVVIPFVPMDPSRQPGVEKQPGHFRQNPNHLLQAGH